jgi:hypothetical protein
LGKDTTHYWVITGLVKAIPGNYRSVDFYCKLCNKRYSEIYSKEEYEKSVDIHIRNVEKEKERKENGIKQI